MAELVRVKGELLLLQGAPGATAAAEDHFRQAIYDRFTEGFGTTDLIAAKQLLGKLGDAGGH